MPRVCAPSESITIAAGMWPFFRGAFRPTDASTVFTASCSPSPIAVPASGSR
jgi:hypothetical protein